MSEMSITLSSTKQTTNVMKITRQIGTATKYVQTTHYRNHSITCTFCSNKQDFDNMPIKEAKAAVVEAGWREGTLDTEPYCLCPECVEEQGTESNSANKLNEVEYE